MKQREAISTRRGRVVQLRAISQADDALLIRLFHRLSPETRWRRFLEPLPDLSDAQIVAEARRLAAIDPAREAALLATIVEGGGSEAVGVARFAGQHDDPARAEFAILVRDDYQGEGLGTAMLKRLIALARQRGVASLWGLTFAENHHMLHLVQCCGAPAHITCHRGELTIELQLLPERLPSPSR